MTFYFYDIHTNKSKLLKYKQCGKEIIAAEKQERSIQNVVIYVRQCLMIVIIQTSILHKKMCEEYSSFIQGCIYSNPV